MSHSLVFTTIFIPYKFYGYNTELQSRCSNPQRGEPDFNNIFNSSNATAGHRGCSTKKGFYGILGPTSPAEVHRGPKHKETALEHRSLKDVPGK